MADPVDSSRRTGLFFAVVGLVLAVAAGVIAFGQSSYCFFENISCARSHEPKEYRGRVFDYEGRPTAETDLLLHDDLYGDRFEASMKTDNLGRFCVRAVEGTRAMYVYVAAVRGRKSSELIVRSAAPVDPRFSDPQLRESLRNRRSSNFDVDFTPFMTLEPVMSATAPRPYSRIDPIGAHGTPELWNGETDTAEVCHEIAGPPWYRYKDARSSWQFRLLGLASLATLALFFVGRLTLPARLRPRLHRVTGVLGVGTMALLLYVWSIL